MFFLGTHMSHICQCILETIVLYENKQLVVLVIFYHTLKASQYETIYIH